MIVVKVTILFGFLTLALGSNCCGQKREIATIAQRNQNADRSKPKKPFALARQENTPVNTNINEAGNEITKALSTDEDKKMATNEETSIRPKKENKRRAKKDKSVNVKKTKTSAAEKKVVKPTGTGLNEKKKNTSNALSPKVLQLLKQEKKMKKNKSEFPECEKDILLCAGAHDPTYSIMFTMMALMMRYLRSLIDKYGLDKSKEQEGLNQNADSN